MEIDLEQRKIALSVRDFAEWGCADGSGRGGISLWRMEAGREWHGVMRATAQREEGDLSCHFEEGIGGSIVLDGWTFVLRGIIDQVLRREGEIEIREVKTVMFPLPEEREVLEARYPSYWVQTATYAVLLQQACVDDGLRLAASLLFVNITDGLTQRCPIQGAEAIVRVQAQRWIPYLNSRLAAESRRVRLKFNRPFSVLRAGQEVVLDQFLMVGARPGVIAFQAPTGFGKTGVALMHGLSLLQKGAVTRLLVLSGKTSGQIQLCEELRRMLAPSEDPPLVLQLRNQRDHRRGLGVEVDIELSRRNLELCRHEIVGLFEDGFLTLETIQQFAAERNVNPYDVSRAAIPYADILICDYNYVFAPGTRHILQDSPDWRPEQMAVIIDEAHNLAERVALAWSTRLTRGGVETLRAEINAENGFVWRQGIQALDRVLDILCADAGSGRLSLTDLYILKAALEGIINAFMRLSMPWDRLSDGALAVWVDIRAACRWFELEGSVLYGERDTSGGIYLSCLDGSAEIGRVLKTFHQVVLMSATLVSQDYAARQWGFPSGALQWIEGEASWREDCYKVRYELKVDTTYRERERYHSDVARIIVAATERAAEPAPVSVFFPSYDYARTVAAYLGVLAPWLRVTLQEPGLSLDDQVRFLEQAIFSSDVLCLILGSNFAEGIDYLGGRVSQAIVIGPALPKVTDRQIALQRECFSALSDDDAFQNAYIIPGIIKINQALGRLVRHPDHRAEVTLVCQRFGQRRYFQFLDPLFWPNGDAG